MREEERVIDLHGDDIPDERLRLVFTCCHPALGEEARIAMTLQTMCGVPTPAIARLFFFVPEPTIAQRLVRAKKKIRTSGIPFEIPPADRIDERLEGVLAVVYLMFTEGYATTDGDVVVRTELCDEAIRLARVLAHLLPTHAETRGLLALMILHHARREARVDANGEIIVLDEQEGALWKKDEIDEGVRLLDEALARESPGPYQIQAAIAALHAAAVKDWEEIAGLYAELESVAPSPSVAIARAVAEGMAFGPDRGIERLETLPDGPLVHAAKADLLRRAGRKEAARRAYEAAIEHARNDRERAFLVRRRDTL